MADVEGSVRYTVGDRVRVQPCVQLEAGLVGTVTRVCRTPLVDGEWYEVELDRVRDGNLINVWHGGYSIEVWGKGLKRA